MELFSKTGSRPLHILPNPFHTLTRAGGGAEGQFSPDRRMKDFIGPAPFIPSAETVGLTDGGVVGLGEVGGQLGYIQQKKIVKMKYKRTGVI